MKRTLVSFLCILCAVACLLTACTPASSPDESTDGATDTTAESTTAESTTAPDPVCQLLFEDNFDGTAPDETKWNIGTAESQPTANGDVSLWDPAMVTLDGSGHLLLKTAWDAEEKVARVGAVTTKGLFESGYGYYEASIKFSLAYARTTTFAITAGDTQIDVLRSINGRKAVSYEHGLANAGDTESLDALRTAYVNIYDGRFHTFGVLRSVEGYTFYIDGQETGFTPASDFAVTEADGFISLFWTAPKTDGAGRNEALHSTPAEMVVDYVRVYSSLPETLGKADNAEPELVFRDDFEGTEMDNTKWTRCPEWTRNDIMYWSNDMTDVDGEGHLIIRMEYDEERNMIRGGGAWTASTFNYGYGYFEACLKLPDVYGAWGAFWMMCGDVWAESAVDGVEIDIIESTVGGDWGHALHSNYGNLNSLGSPTMVPVDTSDGEFHTFGVLRAETGYFFYIDGMLSAIVPAYRYEACPVIGRMKLTCEAAGWSGGGTAESFASLPAKMEVDYVRVYSAMPDLSAIHP